MPYEFLDDIGSELTFTCDVYRQSNSKDALTGEVSESFAILTAAIKCLIQPNGGKQSLKAQGLNIDATHTGFFFFGADIKERDRILFNTRWYDVKYIEKDFCNTSHHYEILLKIDSTTPNMTGAI